MNITSIKNYRMIYFLTNVATFLLSRFDSGFNQLQRTSENELLCNYIYFIRKPLPNYASRLM